MDEKQRRIAFEFFNEVGIINQLATSAFNKRLPDGLHISHFSVLNHLVRLGDGKTPLSLANAFQVTKGTMTHTLTTLRNRGFVRFASHETDGRSKLVYLTDKGRAFREQAIVSLESAFQALDDLLNMRDLETMLPQLTEMRRVLDENRDI